MQPRNNTGTESYISQITAYLDRIARVLRRMENSAAAACGLSPLQLKVLLFLNSRASHSATVGFLAEEFEVSEPTMSDSLRVLQQKKLLTKLTETADRRVRALGITPAGRKLVARCDKLLQLPIGRLEADVLENLSVHLHQLVATLFENSALHHARLCYTCKYFGQSELDRSLYCGLLQKRLVPETLQSDCSDHVYRTKVN